MKTYEAPMIEITSIHNEDILATSGGLVTKNFSIVKRSDLTSANDNSISF